MSEHSLSESLDAATNFPFTPTKGSKAIEILAQHFPQLYLQPVNPQESEATLASQEEMFRAAATKGVIPEGALLEHFATNPADELRVVDTPAGPVPVLYLANRNAFETFLQCIGHRARAVAIAPSIGAISYRGINDWARVRAAQNAYLQAGGQSWPFDMLGLAKKGTFKSELIVISEGPYSNIPASATPYGQEQWLGVSREIRLHHECAHIVCRRMMPENISPLWDEITADAVGLIKATGRYDKKLAATFLGVNAKGYAGGRLIEYLSDEQKSGIDKRVNRDTPTGIDESSDKNMPTSINEPTDEKMPTDTDESSSEKMPTTIDELAKQVYAAIIKLGKRAQGINPSDAYDFLIELKREPLMDL